MNKNDSSNNFSPLSGIGLKVADNIDAMLAYWDKSEICRFANKAYRKWFGISRDDIIGKMSMRDLLGTDLYKENIPHIKAVLEGKPCQFSRIITMSDGSCKDVQVSYYPDISNGEIPGFYVHVTDISQQTQLQKQLSESERQFQDIIETMPDALLILNKNGVILQANIRAQQLFANNNLAGANVSSLLTGNSWPGLKTQLSSFLLIADNSRLRKPVELIATDAAGRMFPVEINISRIGSGDDAIISAAIRDISLRSEMEKSMSRMAVIAATSSDAIISKKMDGTILTWNKGAENILGYTADEAVGKNITMLFPPELYHEEKLLLSRILKGESIEQFETERVRKDGKHIQVSITLSAIYNASGEIAAISTILRNITIQKEAEEALRKSNERNRIFVQQAPNAIAMFDKEMCYLAASRKWIDDYHLQGKEIIGKSHYDIFPEIGDDWKQIHKECLAGSINTCDEAPFRRADGTVQWIEWDVRPWYEDEGVIGGILMYTGDITKIKEKEERERKTQYILEKTSQIARIATWEVITATGTATWSEVANEIFEFPRNTSPSLEQVMSHYKPGRSRDNLLIAIRRSIEEGISYDVEAEIITAKGNERWLRIIGEAEFVDGHCVRRFGILQDITRSKDAEEKISRINESLEAILNSGHVSIISTDMNGVITTFNHGAEVLLGYSKEEMVGKQTPVIIHKPEEIAARSTELTEELGYSVDGFNTFVEKSRLGNHDTQQWTYIRKDGSSFPVQLVVTAIRNKKGTIKGFLGIATDISELKKAEDEMSVVLEYTNDQNERLRNFAHIVSHNLRSHSGNIGMLIELFLDENKDLAGNEYINMLQKASESLKQTIKDLNEIVLINTSTEGRLVPVNLRQCTAAAITNVSQLANNASVTICNNIDASLDVSVVPAYLDSIILNLITNGIKYRSPERKATLQLSSAISDGFAVLSVTDNGLGIDLEKFGSKLFGMYKTFHGNEDARGIGLFITRNQIEAMGGKIEVESEPGKGTTFRVFLRQAGEVPPKDVVS